MADWSFYRNKRVLITGHTGFKGSWMSSFLLEIGAEVIGYALEPEAGNPSMYQLCRLNKEVDSVIGDVRDLDRLQKTVSEKKPEFVIHMAAQPIVRASYQSPVYTYDVNVMGTVNILESIRQNECVKSFLNVTTDKVYRNREWDWGYRENEEINGYDPYSNSKSCSELVTSSYRSSYFSDPEKRMLPVSTARAGNVIGGGDFAADRIVPDCVRAIHDGKEIGVRNPFSVRPYQHVLEPVAAYLMILREQCENFSTADAYNVGPDEGDCLMTGSLVERFCDIWERHTGNAVAWKNEQKRSDQPHEANFLKLDCARLKRVFSWKPCWNAEMALEKTVEWYAEYEMAAEMKQCTQKQIQEYLRCWQERGNR